MLITGLNFYDDESTDILCSIGDAAVIGDMFCNKRMFGNEYCMMQRTEQLFSAGRKIILQTPMYVTERNFHNTIAVIENLSSRGMLYGVIVQDMGLLYKLGRIKKDYKIIWNCIDIGRSRVSNHLYYMNVKELGADYIQTKDVAAAEKLNEIGFSVILEYGSMSYGTMNRECYYMYQHNIYDKNCRRGCVCCNEYLVQPELNLELSIDGYILGRKISYDNTEKVKELFKSDNISVCVYADSGTELVKRIAEITGE